MFYTVVFEECDFLSAGFIRWFNYTRFLPSFTFSFPDCKERLTTLQSKGDRIIDGVVAYAYLNTFNCVKHGDEKTIGITWRLGGNPGELFEEGKQVGDK